MVLLISPVLQEGELSAPKVMTPSKQSPHRSQGTRIAVLGTVGSAQPTPPDGSSAPTACPHGDSTPQSVLGHRSSSLCPQHVAEGLGGIYGIYRPACVAEVLHPPRSHGAPRPIRLHPGTPGTSGPHAPCLVPGCISSGPAIPCPCAAQDTEGDEGCGSQQVQAVGLPGARNVPALFVPRLVSNAVQISVGFFEMKIKLIKVGQILCSGPCCGPEECLFLGAAQPAPGVINTLCMPVFVGQSLLLMLNMS